MPLSGLLRPVCAVKSIRILLALVIPMRFMLMGIIVEIAKQFPEFCSIGCHFIMHIDRHIIAPVSPNVMVDSLRKHMVVRDGHWRTIPFHNNEFGGGGGETEVHGP